MIAAATGRISELVALGGPVVALLLALSVLAVAVVLWKAAVFELEAVGRSAPRGFLARLLGQARAAQRRGVPPGELRERLLARLERDFGRVGAGLRVLEIVSQVAPLLGLFGTVLGMIDAFRSLQEAGSSADPSLLAGGIWVALLTTAAGLAVAMPASVLLSWFDARLAAHRRMAEEAVEDLLAPGVLDHGAG
ncbi:MotA/TolQ/ExbB proton channel family protein [Poseidonocella sp. HB161398]|uniref:MotA/TolQ/ExbB proton channel family protein n=1 Tax=Poseidonocella sp. HB161398 TaxID=2320855 RepID=UPI001109BE28|nr:MotA/TolQ/ExbB proton channel family protein [Poseidonocella sp. HB161398]